MKHPESSCLSPFVVPIRGVRLGTAKAGIRKTERKDLLVIALDEGTTVGAVFTENKFCAAPVLIGRQVRDSGAPVRALVVNTGIANAGTGELGLKNTQEVCDEVARGLGIPSSSVMPFSTGVILEHLPVERIAKALPSALKVLGPNCWDDAAEAILTTDTRTKQAASIIDVNNVPVAVTGIAKGSGMIHPNMATTLGFIATDASISQSALQILVKDVADESFNSISVDGDTSTNDSFAIMATGKATNERIEDSTSPGYAALRDGLLSVARSLAEAVVLDGVGATKLVSIQVKGARTSKEARAVADAVAQSPMFKTALFGSDANIGRLLAAVGYASRYCDSLEDLSPSQFSVWLADVPVVHHGERAEGYLEEDGRREMEKSRLSFRIELTRGNGRAQVLTCDLSDRYAQINAAYRK